MLSYRICETGCLIYSLHMYLIIFVGCALVILRLRVWFIFDIISFFTFFYFANHDFSACSHVLLVQNLILNIGHYKFIKAFFNWEDAQFRDQHCIPFILQTINYTLRSIERNGEAPVILLQMQCIFFFISITIQNDKFEVTIFWKFIIELLGVLYKLDAWRCEVGSEEDTDVLDGFRDGFCYGHNSCIIPIMILNFFIFIFWLLRFIPLDKVVTQCFLHIA